MNLPDVKYRSEIISVDGETDFMKVMQYECMELGNIDIPQTLIDGILSEHDIVPSLQEFIQVIETSDDGTLPIHLLSIYHDTVEAIYEVTGVRVNTCLWLVDDPDDLELYDLHNLLTPDNIDCYEVSDIVLSDCESEGKLYGFEGTPKSLGTWAQCQP